MLDFENSSKKRKWEEENFEKQSKVSKTQDLKSFLDVDLHLGRPLPLEWQRCLDIQSGQIHFYNTTTHKRTSKDPRRSPERLHSSHVRLDLELNLAYSDDESRNSHNSDDRNRNSGQQINNSGGLKRSPSWVSFEVNDQQEMVAAVCKRCHMLVMLCKSSPSCPNCKFMHPLDQSPHSLLKPSFKLLCCKD